MFSKEKRRRRSRYTTEVLLKELPRLALDKATLKNVEAVVVRRRKSPADSPIIEVEE